MIRGCLIAVLLLALGYGACAQRYPERRSVRTGNKLYEKGDYAGAETSYRRARQQNAGLREAENNLGNALYKQERYDEAARSAAEAVKMAETPEQAARAYYNEGNALFKQRKLTEALEAYKNSLRLNPDDQQAKFNLAYTQKLLDKDRNGGGGDQNQDENQDQNQDENRNKDQNQDRNDDPDENRDDNRGNGQDRDDRNDNQDGQPEQNEGGENDPRNQEENQPREGMSREEAAQMLDAVQGNEDNTKKKVDARKARKVGARSGKNW